MAVFNPSLDLKKLNVHISRQLVSMSVKVQIWNMVMILFSNYQFSEVEQP
jgi:hypothetical protein